MDTKTLQEIEWSHQESCADPVRKARERLDDFGPTPTVEELARPFRQGIYLLAEVAERASGLDFAAEFDKGIAGEARDLVRAVRRAVELCVVAAHGSTMHRSDALPDKVAGRCGS
jgi:hypothetical protein